MAEYRGLGRPWALLDVHLTSGRPVWIRAARPPPQPSGKVQPVPLIVHLLRLLGLPFWFGMVPASDWSVKISYAKTNKEGKP